MTDDCWVPVPEGSPYPIANLPLGVGHLGDGRWRAWAAIGDSALDLTVLDQAGLFAGLDLPGGCFGHADLNVFLATGPTIWSSVRSRLTDLLTDVARASTAAPFMVQRSSLTMGVPTAPVDYVDFYSSLHHATNLGRLFRPNGEALMPNWKRIPIGYHGRVGTLVADGAEIPRPHGLRLIDGEPAYGPCRSLDIELEVGAVVGVRSERGSAIRIEDTDQHLYGLCLVNDWSARDIQAYEYQPLGPFLGKSFATSVSPWLVSIEALAPFRVPSPVQDPPVADYPRDRRDARRRPLRCLPQSRSVRRHVLDIGPATGTHDDQRSQRQHGRPVRQRHRVRPDARHRGQPDRDVMER
jgi:fumarylacetoacetase